MDYVQVKQPNLSIVGSEGLCLVYVREVFGVPAKYGTAISAWDSAAYRHGDEQPPIDIAVPIWFSYSGPDGHVAVWDKGTIYSTSAQGDKIFSSIQDLINWMGEGFTYLGWSEDINGVRVVSVVTPAPPVPTPTPPAAPMPIPTSTIPYLLIKDVPGYTTATNAGNHTPPKGDTTVPAGSYYIFNTYPTNSNLVNITKVLGKPGAWINKLDNVDTPVPVVAPVVENVAPTSLPPDWRTSYVAYTNPLVFVCMEEDDITINGKPAVGYMVKDISGAKASLPLRWTQEITIGGEFTKDDTIYYRPQAATNKLLWYGIPKDDPPIIEQESVIYDPTTTTADRQVSKSLTAHDYEVLIVAWFQKIVNKIKG